MPIDLDNRNFPTPRPQYAAAERQGILAKKRCAGGPGAASERSTLNEWAGSAELTANLQGISLIYSYCDLAPLETPWIASLSLG
ncbi:MAG TPA: hypothetical protein VK025_14910 [Steroidobacter sp.]|nr:hypothetical protein [Steroidobacteraceae bacterium]HLS82688.1 hypothetical protein [Steroidobacter sp.]